MSKLHVITEKEEEKKPWYRKGLRFKCTGCGKCCSGSPGFVFLTEQDILNLIKHLKISREAFVKHYTKSLNQRLSLRDDTPNYGCIFLKEGKYCQVYQARPTQCQTYPFWPMNLSSEKEWENEAKRCEGIDHPEAPLISVEEIEQIASIQKN